MGWAAGYVEVIGIYLPSTWNLPAGHTGSVNWIRDAIPAELFEALNHQAH